MNFIRDWIIGIKLPLKRLFKIICDYSIFSQCKPHRHKEIDITFKFEVLIKVTSTTYLCQNDVALIIINYIT